MGPDDDPHWSNVLRQTGFRQHVLREVAFGVDDMVSHPPRTGFRQKALREVAFEVDVLSFILPDRGVFRRPL